MNQVIQISKKENLALTYLPVFLAATTFSLPISSTLKSIFLFTSLVLIALTPICYRDLKAVLSETWCQASILLFALAVISCFWSPATFSEKFLVVEKYSKLLYLPLLAVGFSQQRTRSMALHAFLLGMIITCSISIFKYVNLIHYHGIDPGHVFRNHIMTGYMMAFSAYLSAVLAIRKQRTIFQLSYGLLFILFSFQVLFVNTGRTGYVIYSLLFLLFIVQTFSWRKALIVSMIGSTLGLYMGFHNAALHESIIQVANDLHDYQHDNKDTSVGYRLQFHEFAQKLFLRHPVLGNGTASFTHLFAEEKPVSSWNRRLLEPHSQYWLALAEFGILGIAVLSLFFVSLLAAAWRLETMRSVALAVILPFLVGNCSDSLLFYSGTGYLFILFMALCLGERVEKMNLKRKF